MEVINLEAESNNPNLDGDFKTLLEIQKTRKDKVLLPASILEDSLTPKKDDSVLDEELKNLPESPIKEERSLPLSKSSEEINSLYQRLIGAVLKDDERACRDVVEKIHEAGKTLGDSAMRDPDNAATALHVALENNCKNVAQFLVRNASQELLMEDYEVVIRKVSSRKTCLHILVEKGLVELTKELLERLSAGQRKDAFLRKFVLTEMKGQRPRPLSAIHLAALHGHVELVDLLVKLGVDVNATNNKNDTPVLWATRGNHIEMVRRLIHYNADLKTENDKGSTPLYWAVRYGFSEMTKVLITEGKADVNQRRKLGLVLPIVLASALGHEEIVEILLGAGADPAARINGGQTALHYAAAVGNEEIVAILIENGLSPDEADDIGNTALMVAVKAGSLNVVRQLIMCNANISAKNKFGETIWDFAIEHKDRLLLERIIQLYRQTRRISGAKTIFPVGKNPLHVAALKGDVEKLRILLNLGADPKCEDASGNTYFHYAARDNRTEILTEFMEEEAVNHQNADGEIPLHLAVHNGHVDAVKILIKKSKVHITNTNGSTPLHVACGSPSVFSEIVNILVETIVKTNNWSLVDAQDMSGNTALHIACKKGRADLLADLSPLNPSVKNKEGDSPMHTSAKTGKPYVLEVMLGAFNKPGKGLYIDEQNAEGDTVLHICAKRGDTVNVEMLIAAGCDLCVKNKEGNTVLHDLVEQSVLEPSNKDNLVAVYHTITQCAALWWCMRQDLHLPEEDSEPYLEIRRTAILYLTSEVYNHQAMNIPVYAGFIGANVMLEAILETEGVYKIKLHNKIIYDVTNLAPETVAENLRKKKVSVYSNKSVVGAEGDPDLANNAGLESCLDVVVKLENQVLATQMLDLNPIKQLVANYWRAYQWIYGLLMLVHIVYMSCYSYYSMPYLAYAASNTSITTFERPRGMALFLVWPIVLLVFEVYYFIVSVYRFIRERRKYRALNIEQKSSSFNLLHLPSTVISGIFNHLDHITLVIFSGFIVTWFVLYTTDAGKVTAYVVAMALVLGWIFTITFVKGFETVHAFSIMLKYIILRDISRFMVIYIFALLAFALALHAIVQIVPGVAAAYPSSWDSLFMTFNMMVGMDDLFGGDYEDSFNDAGVNPLFAKIVYIAYIILATIILLNLLIAMMSDTYNGIKQREGTTWRVGSVSLALQIERSMPFIKKFFKSVGVIKDRIKLDPNTNRYMMTLTLKEANLNEVVEVNELVKAISRMEGKIDQLKTTHNKLQDELNVLAEGQKSLLQGAFGQSTPRLRRVTMYQMAAAMAERPATSQGARAART